MCMIDIDLHFCMLLFQKKYVLIYLIVFHFLAFLAAHHYEVKNCNLSNDSWNVYVLNVTFQNIRLKFPTDKFAFFQGWLNS